MSRGGPAARKKAAYQARLAASAARMRDTEDALERARRTPTHDDRGAWPAWQRAATDAWITSHPDDAWLRRPEPGHRPTFDEIIRRASRMKSAMAGVEPAWRIGPDSPRRRLADAQVGFFHEQHIGLYGPIGEAIAAIRAASGGRVLEADMETLVRFLEADIYCDRSGYVTVDVIDALRRSTLSEEATARLRGVVLGAVDGRDRREFRAFCRLAVSVADDGLRAELEKRAAVRVQRVTRHARWVLDALDAAG